jgi:hemolysin activation/secretion protein
MSNLRGFKTGTRAADTLVAASAELVVPLSSPISVGRIGVSAFIDAGTAYDDGQRLSNQEWMRGIGGSMWFTAAFFRMNIAIAHGHESSTRVHVGATVGF